MTAKVEDKRTRVLEEIRGNPAGTIRSRDVSVNPGNRAPFRPNKTAPAQRSAADTQPGTERLLPGLPVTR